MPTLTVTGLPVGQEPVAGGAEAAVGAWAVSALVLAQVQHLALVEVCGVRGVKVSGEAPVPSGALGQAGSHLPSAAKPRDTPTQQIKRETGQHQEQKLPFRHKVSP